jgi:glycosyltransferase involved in cell wall biosynthesis
LRAQIREKNSIPADAIVIAIICRLAPAKGLDIALEAMSDALSALSSDLRAQIRMIIAGDGPLRRDVEEEIQRRNLGQTCLLWGEASEEEVISLLGISDIFLYTSRRGTGYPVAILEAMASACAIIASSVPLANYRMLADGRGIAVPAENVEETSIALTKLVNDLELCRSMGRKAREYVARQHSPAMLKRVLMRATYWSELDGFLKPDAESKG